MRLSRRQGLQLMVAGAAVAGTGSSGSAEDHDAWYHVSPTGDDGADGLSPGTAWRTLAKVGAATFRPGDRVLLEREGVWRETLTFPSSGAPGRPITLGAYGRGARPRISGAEVIAGWQSDAPDMHRVALPARPDVVVVDGRVWDDAAAPPTHVDRTWAWAAGTLYLRDRSGNPDATGKVVEAARRDHCFLAAAKAYLTIEEVELDTCNDQAAQFDACGAGLVVRNCTVRAGGEIASGQAHLGFGDGCPNAKVLRVDFVDLHRGKAIMFWDCSGPTEVAWCTVTITKTSAIAHNAIQISGERTPHNDAWVHDNAFDMRPAFPTGDYNPKHVMNIGDGVGGVGGIVERNVIYGGAGGISMGLTGASPAKPVIVRYNRTFETGTVGGGLSFLEHHRVLENYEICYNQLVDGTVGIELWDTGGDTVRANFRICNNTVVNASRAGIEIRSPLRGASGIFNNIVWCPGAENVLRVDLVAIPHQFRVDHNLLGPESPRFIHWLGSDYGTLAAFQNEAGEGRDTIADDPRFVDGKRDYALAEGSPAVDGGIAAGLSADITGVPVPQGAAPDLGCHERSQTKS